MAPPNMQGDALRVFEVLKSGGTAICPADVGYAIMTCNPRALEKVFNTKKRGSHKRHAMIGSYAIHRSLHTMSPEHAEIVTSLTQDFDLPLGVIGKYKPEHELIKGLDDLTMEASSVGGTISVLVNAGKFQDELTKLTAEAALPLLGSSANLSGTGTKYRVEDINREILDIADIVIDYGLLKWWIHGRSSTLIDFSGPSLEVVRIGACYDTIKDLLKRHWGIELPNDPGMASLPAGHMKVPPPLQSLEKLVASRS